MNQPSTIVLLSCARQKLGHCARAEDLYVGDLFRKSLAYARQRRPTAIFILSAKYGLIEPAEEICPYDITLNRMSLAEVRKWSDSVFAQLNRRVEVEKDHFVFLAGVCPCRHAPGQRTIAVANAPALREREQGSEHIPQEHQSRSAE
jgi:hypothetical protein